MTRTALFAALLTGVLSAASRADTGAIPPPREVRPDGSRDPAPPPDPDTQAARAAKPGAGPVVKSDNPAETVEKIIKNSKDITDRLAKTDTGADTRKTQDETLALIDLLLNPPNPPPSGGADNKQDKNDNKDKGKDQKKDMNPSGGMDNMPEPKGGQPKDDNRQGNGRRPRTNQGDEKQPKDPGKDPMGGSAKQEPMPGGMAKAEPNGPMMPMGGTVSPTGGVPMGVTGAKPSVPLDDEVEKKVWGHLPDKLRQQVSQYYKEQFMPRYSDLLRQYYSSLADQNTKPPEMKR
jgi:hypothetical protein